jgi:hypothetical protein
MFLKEETVGIIQRGGTVWETASLLNLFKGWCTFVKKGQSYSCRQWAGTTST